MIRFITLRNNLIIIFYLISNGIIIISMISKKHHPEVNYRTIKQKCDGNKLLKINK